MQNQNRRRLQIWQDLQGRPGSDARQCRELLRGRLLPSGCCIPPNGSQVLPELGGGPWSVLRFLRAAFIPLGLGVCFPFRAGRSPSRWRDQQHRQGMSWAAANVQTIAGLQLPSSCRFSGSWTRRSIPPPGGPAVRLSIFQIRNRLRI